MNLYDNVILESDINYLRTPTRNLYDSDELYLNQNGSMIYLGTYSQVRNNSDNFEGTLIDKDGTNYGRIGRPLIDQNLFILKPEVQKNPDNKKNTNAGNFKSIKSHSKRSYRRRSGRKRSYRRRSHHKRPHRRKSSRHK